MKIYKYLFLLIPFCNAMDEGKNNSKILTKKPLSPLAILKSKDAAQKRDDSPERALSPRKQENTVEILLAAEKIIEENKMQQDARLKRIPSATHLK